MTIRLPEDMARRLEVLAKATRRSKTSIVREALSRALEDLEDAYLAETIYEEFLKSGEAAVPLDEVERRLGLAK